MHCRKMLMGQIDHAGKASPHAVREGSFLTSQQTFNRESQQDCISEFLPHLLPDLLNWRCHGLNVGLCICKSCALNIELKVKGPLTVRSSRGRKHALPS